MKKILLKSLLVLNQMDIIKLYFSEIVKSTQCVSIIAFHFLEKFILHTFQIKK